MSPQVNMLQFSIFLHMKCITNYIISITMGERLEHLHSKVWDQYDFI